MAQFAPNLKPFREFKPRKATYGFQTRFGITTVHAIAEVVYKVYNSDPNAMFDEKFDMGDNSLKVYTNDEATATMLREYCY